MRNWMRFATLGASATTVAICQSPPSFAVSIAPRRGTWQFSATGSWVPPPVSVEMHRINPFRQSFEQLNHSLLPNLISNGRESKKFQLFVDLPSFDSCSQAPSNARGFPLPQTSTCQPLWRTTNVYGKRMYTALPLSSRWGRLKGSVT